MNDDERAESACMDMVVYDLDDEEDHHAAIRMPGEQRVWRA